MPALGPRYLSLALLLATGCHLGFTHDGEITRNQCEDGLDNDDDGHIDCEERACRVFEDVCGAAPPDCEEAPGSAGSGCGMPSCGKDGGCLADAGPGPALDASLPDAGSDASIVDAGPPEAGEPMDAAPPECDATRPCEAGVCLSGECATDQPRYDIVGSHAQVPDEVNGECLDTLPGCDSTFCPCTSPEPFLEVWLAEALLGKTDPPTPGTTSPMWDQVLASGASLAAGDTLELRLYDADGELTPDRIFSCPVTFEPFEGASEALSCDGEGGVVTIEIVPVP